MSAPAETIAVREATRDDRDAVLSLLSASLRWVPDDLFGRFFVWKHEQNPSGPSPAWVATDGDRIVGFRTFVRWEFDHPDGRVRRAVRAVDTATHPDYQGRGIFNRLTVHALEQLRADGVDFVFNTPNDKSRPGYLKMGWHTVGRLPAAIRPTSIGALTRLVRSRVPADRWSRSTSAGAPAAEVLADDRVTALLEVLPAPVGLRTRRTAAYLRWRYGFAPLQYRAIACEGDPQRGLAVFRVRRRGQATEAACCELLAPDADSAVERRLQRAVARECGADYVIRIGGSRADRAGYVRLPGQGPMLTWRGVNAENHDVPTLRAWELQLGDVELF